MEINFPSINALGSEFLQKLENFPDFKNMFHLNPQKVNFDEQLGVGGFATVHPYQRDLDDNQWVVKVMFAKDFDTFLTYMHEIVLGFSCNHPAVLPIRGYFVETLPRASWRIFIKLPRMKETLKAVFDRHVKTNTPFIEDEIIKYFYTLTCGLEYLHNRKIAHRDIKPANILIDTEGAIKIADIGIGKFVGEEETTQFVTENAGTPSYQAPELMSSTIQMKKKDLYQTDIWSLGVVMLELCLLKTKVVNLTIFGQEREVDLRKKIESLEGKYSKGLIDLLLDLLRYKSGQRKTISEVRNFLEQNYATLLGLQHTREKMVKEASVQTDISMVKDIENNERLENIKEEESQTTNKHEEIILEEKKEEFYAENNLEPAVYAERLETLKKELQESWKELFEFELKEDLMIKRVNWQKVNDETINEFIRAVSYKQEKMNLKRLNSIGFTFDSCKHITDEGIRDFAKYIGANFRNLEHFKLNLEWCVNLTDQGVKDLISYDGINANKLRTLRLNFFCCDRITNQGVKDLGIQIGRNLKDLESLELNFAYCTKIKDFGLHDLMIQVSHNLKKIQQLFLNFKCCDQITNGGIISLGFQISANLKDLVYLALDFSACPQITDEGINTLAEQVGINLVNLHQLELNFGDCHHITDGGLNSVALSLELNLKKLNYIQLSFYNCKLITDEGIKNLAIRLRVNSKNITNLHLNFFGCRQITDKGIKELANQLGINFKHLQYLSLNFYSCEQITDQGVQELVFQIGFNLKSLIVLSLNLGFCDKISDEARTLLNKSLKFIPQLNIS